MITRNEWRGLWYRLTHHRAREAWAMFRWLVRDYGLFRRNYPKE